MKSIALVAALALLTGCSSPTDDDAFRSTLSTRFKDPASLQFSDVEANAAMICGQVNGKNGFGAYDGFQPFVFDRATNNLYLLKDVGLDLKASFAMTDAATKCANASTQLKAILAHQNVEIDAVKRKAADLGVPVN